MCQITFLLKSTARKIFDFFPPENILTVLVSAMVKIITITKFCFSGARCSVAKMVEIKNKTKPESLYVWIDCRVVKAECIKA